MGTIEVTAGKVCSCMNAYTKHVKMISKNCQSVQPCGGEITESVVGTIQDLLQVWFQVEDVHGWRHVMWCGKNLTAWTVVWNVVNVFWNSRWAKNSGGTVRNVTVDGLRTRLIQTKSKFYSFFLCIFSHVTLNIWIFEFIIKSINIPHHWAQFFLAYLTWEAKEV